MWDVAAQQWAAVDGDYVFKVGGSSRDLTVAATVIVGASSSNSTMKA